MNCKDTIKVMAAGGLVVLVFLGAQHLCKVHYANIEHDHEMQEENLRHNHMTEILEKLQPSENNNDKNEAA